MLRSFMRHLRIVVFGFLGVSFASLASAQTSQIALREVAADANSGFATYAYTAYIELGSPQRLTEAQFAQLSGLTRDLPQADKVVRSGADGAVQVTLPMNSNDIVLVKLWRNKAAR